MSGLTLGKYTPFNSFIHKVDPRVKILALIALMVAIFFPFNIVVPLEVVENGETLIKNVSVTDWKMTFIMGGILLVFTIILMISSHVSFRQLFGSLKSMWFVVIFLLIVNCIVPPKNPYCNLIFDINGFKVYWDALFQSLKIILRLVLMLTLTMILTATTKPLDLTYALEWFLTPLKLIKFPAHEVAMTISIALRFIPTLLDETDRIMKAQESRGVDFKHGKVSSRLKAIISLIIPLFISSFQRSEELADAMEARGYDPKAKRTRYHKMSFDIRDLFVILLVGAITAGIIAISVNGYNLGFDYFVNGQFYNVVNMTEHFLPILGVSCCGIVAYVIILGVMEANLRKQK